MIQVAQLYTHMAIAESLGKLVDVVAEDLDGSGTVKKWSATGEKVDEMVAEETNA